jgi:hypothetical protein
MSSLQPYYKRQPAADKEARSLIGRLVPFIPEHLQRIISGRLWRRDWRDVRGTAERAAVKVAVTTLIAKFQSEIAIRDATANSIM